MGLATLLTHSKRKIPDKKNAHRLMCHYTSTLGADVAAQVAVKQYLSS